MKHLPIASCLLIGLIVNIVNADSGTTYKHEIVHPNPFGFKGQLHLEGRPISLSTEFKIKPPHIQMPPRFLSFLPGVRHNEDRTSNPIANFFTFLRENSPPAPVMPRLLFNNLFTPSAGNEKAETKGQVDMYQQALKEQKDEEKEQAINAINDITTEFQTYIDPTTAALNFNGEQPKSFVDVKKVSNGKETKYQYEV